MSETDSKPQEAWLDRLEHDLGVSFPAIRKAQAVTKARRATLEKVFTDKVAPDTSLVLFGSIARGEVTSGSDTDWLLLVDGQAFPEHLDQQHAIATKLKKLKKYGFDEPGRSGIFGGMMGSH